MSDKITPSSVVIEEGNDSVAVVPGGYWWSSADDLSHTPLRAAHQQVETLSRYMGMARLLEEVNIATGGYVSLLPDYQFCPVVKGSNGQIAPLYQIVEAIDGLIDYEHLKEEFPFLSYAQISGAILFLRKVMQLNVAGIDIDECENEELTANSSFIEELTRAINDREISRVLNFNE